MSHKNDGTQTIAMVGFVTYKIQILYIYIYIYILYIYIDIYPCLTKSIKHHDEVIF